MNPRTPERQAPEAAWRNTIQINWKLFKERLLNEFLPGTVSEYFNNAKKYSHCLVIRDFQSLQLLSRSQRLHAMKGLSALSKFLGVHEEFRMLVRKFGLKWERKTSSELIIERITKTVNADELFNWIRKLRKSLPELTDFIEFITITGLRYSEAVKSYNLIIKLTNEQKIHQYYDEEKEVLAHFKFKELFIRRTKKCFISFVPRKLVQQISRTQSLQWKPLKNAISRKIDCLKFADIREYYASYMTKYLSQPEIDFLQGRVSATVFMRHYFNPALISDLKARVFQGIEEVSSFIF